MFNNKNLDRTSLDSLSSAYLSDQSPDDLSLLHRLNTLLSSNNLPKLTNILDVTPSLLIALYESLPPFQRVPFVDATSPGFATRLRNMKLLVGSIASGRNGLLTEKMRRQLEELDLRKFCEKDAATVRDAIEVIVDVGERGRLAGMSTAGPETPRSKKLKSKGTPRGMLGVDRIAGNDVEGSPTPTKKQPVLVLPTTVKVEDNEISTDDKDSGWDGSILGVTSQTDKVGYSRDRLTNESDLSGTVIPDLPGTKQRKTIPVGRSPIAAVPSPTSSCSSVPPGFIEQLSARVNAIVARCPAPSPYSKENLRDRNNEDTLDTLRRRQLARGDYSMRRIPARILAMDRTPRHSSKSDQFGGELKVPTPASLSSIEKSEKKSSEGSVLKNRKGVTNVVKKSLNRTERIKAEREEEEKSQWVTEDESGIDIPLSFSSLAKKDILDSRTGRGSIPTKETGLNTEVAIQVPLPTSRPGSTTSRNSKQGNESLPKSPLPFPPSLLRTMHWATSLPTPPLSPNAQRTEKMSSRLAPGAFPTSKPQLGRLRRVVSASPLPTTIQKKRSPVKRHGSGGLIGPGGANDIVIEGSQGDGDEWVSVNSRERSSIKTSRHGTPLPPPRADKKRMLASVPIALASFGQVAINIKNNSKGVHDHNYNDDDEHDENDDTDYDDDDRTSLYSASTVSWGEDDPFTAVLRQKRQIALEKLQAMERSFNHEIETKKRTRMESREPSVNDRSRRGTFSGIGSDEVEGGDYSTDSEGGVTDVEEELRLLEEIGKQETVRQQLLLKRLMARGT